MATSGGGFAASGLLQGFAQSYNQAYQRRTQQDLEQRHQLASFLVSSMPNMRPEAQQDAAQRLLSIYSTPVGKKLDKKLSDFSTLGQGSQQAQAQAGQAGAASSQQGLQQGMAAPPTPPAQGGTPGAEPTAQPSIAGGIPQQAPPIPAPPPYNPLLSPQEHIQQQANQAGAVAGATQEATINAHLHAYDLYKASHPNATMQEYMAASGRGLGVGAFTPHVLSKNVAGSDLTNAHPDITTVGGEQLDPKQFYDLALVGGQPVAVPAGLGAQVALSNIAGTPFKSFIQQRMAEGMTREQANTQWNTTQSVQHGFKSEQQPDGTIKLVPVDTTTTKTKGGITPPPGSAGNAGSSGGTGGIGGVPGRTVGGKLPPEVVKAQSEYLQSIERYNVMSSALPKALAGDQQAMINLLYNHIGMTVGLQKGARITRDIINEAQTSAPWMATLLARIGVGNEFTMSPDALRGVVIPPDTMHNMIGLAEDRVTEDYNKFNAQKTAYAGGGVPTPESVKAGGKARQTGKPLSQTAPPPGGGGMVNMKAPNGAVKPVPADQVEHYKSLGATVVQ